MARPLRIEVPGGVYHVTQCGNARAEIFVAGDRNLVCSCPPMEDYQEAAE